MQQLLHDCPITLSILVLTIGASMYGWSNKDFLDGMMMKPWMVKHKGQYYRFMTSGFVHLNWPHLIFNMLTFFFMGKPLEMYFGTVRNGGSYFLLLYLLAIIVSDLPTYFKNKDNSWYSGLGASGGVAAIVFSYIVIKPASTLSIWYIPVPAVIFGLLYLAYSWYAARNNRDGINHDAHFWGAVFGMVYTFALVHGTFWGFIEHLKNFSLF